MRGILVAAAVAFALSIIGTPVAIRLFRVWGWGQRIREDWAGDHPQAHHAHLEKMGTPTAGGVVFITAMVVAYFVSRLFSPRGISATRDLRPRRDGRAWGSSASSTTRSRSATSARWG